MILHDDIRKSLGIDLHESIVIFDEAHNLEEVSCMNIISKIIIHWTLNSLKLLPFAVVGYQPIEFRRSFTVSIEKNTCLYGFVFASL